MDVHGNARAKDSPRVSSELKAALRDEADLKRKMRKLRHDNRQTNSAPTLDLAIGIG